MKPFEEVEQFWTVLGWDITDGKGAELNCAFLFGRQIIAVEGRLVEGARFCSDGSGELADQDENDGNDRLSAALEAEVKAWIAGRK